jgi:acid phosphatase
VPARTRTIGLAGLVALSVVGLVLTATAAPAVGAPADPCAIPGVSTPATYAHVVVIMEENLSYKNAIGSIKAPYLNQLASQCALATNFHNETHGSQPNYMAATSGVATASGVHSANTSIYQQVSSWNDLEE